MSSIGEWSCQFRLGWWQWSEVARFNMEDKIEKAQTGSKLG